MDLYFIAGVIVKLVTASCSNPGETNFYGLFQIEESSEGHRLLEEKQTCSKKGEERENGEQRRSPRAKYIPEGKGEGSNNILSHNVQAPLSVYTEHRNYVTQACKSSLRTVFVDNRSEIFKKSVLDLNC